MSSEALRVAFGRFCFVSICGLLVTFAMSTFVVTLLTPWYPPQAVQVGMLRRNTLARASHGLGERREMAVCTDNT